MGFPVHISVNAMAAGQVEATAIFAQVARERRLEMVANMSHKQARPYARSKASAAHWLSEQIFNWFGVSVAHLRIDLFADWLLYVAPQIKAGRYVTPFDPDSQSRCAHAGCRHCTRCCGHSGESRTSYRSGLSTERSRRVQSRRIGEGCGTSPREADRFRTTGTYGVPQAARFGERQCKEAAHRGRQD